MSEYIGVLWWDSIDPGIYGLGGQRLFNTVMHSQQDCTFETTNGSREPNTALSFPSCERFNSTFCSVLLVTCKRRERGTTMDTSTGVQSVEPSKIHLHTTTNLPERLNVDKLLIL